MREERIEAREDELQSKAHTQPHVHFRKFVWSVCEVFDGEFEKRMTHRKLRRRLHSLGARFRPRVL